MKRNIGGKIVEESLEKGDIVDVVFADCTIRGEVITSPYGYFSTSVGVSGMWVIKTKIGQVVYCKDYLRVVSIVE